MNCEQCQELVHDFVDGALSREDSAKLKLHLEDCLACSEVRNDLQAIVSFCQQNRGQYDETPNERALWLRIRNVIEAELATPAVAVPAAPVKQGFWPAWLSRSWELSVPQLTAAVAALVVVVSLATAVGIRRWESTGSVRTSDPGTTRHFIATGGANLRDRFAQQQQAIAYWNQRVELNKARWNSQMRETFDRNLQVIDHAVNDSLIELNRNPHDEVSEEMLNAALNEKLALLKEFSDL